MATVSRSHSIEPIAPTETIVRRPAARARSRTASVSPRSLGSARWQCESVRFKWVRSDIFSAGCDGGDSGGREFFAAREEGGGRVHFMARLEAVAVGCAFNRV